MVVGSKNFAVGKCSERCVDDLSTAGFAHLVTSARCLGEKMEKNAHWGMAFRFWDNEPANLEKIGAAQI